FGHRAAELRAYARQIGLTARELRRCRREIGFAGRKGGPIALLSGNSLLQLLMGCGFSGDQGLLAAAFELSPLSVRLGPFSGAARVGDRGVRGFNAGVRGLNLGLRGVDVFATLQNVRVL